MKEFTMRTAVTDEILKIQGKNTYFLTADVGYGVLEPLKEKMKERFINIGLAEQTMIGVAAGLALSGKEVFTYTMCSFYLRAFEFIKLDLCYQNLPVKMLGVGSQWDYEYLGSTHFGIDDDKAISQLLNIDVVTPKDQKELRKYLRMKIKRPMYIRIGGYIENMDSEIDWDKLKEYPHSGGSRNHFKLMYGKNENKK